jgi:hypothetical protein
VGAGERRGRAAAAAAAAAPPPAAPCWGARASPAAPASRAPRAPAPQARPRAPATPPPHTQTSAPAPMCTLGGSTRSARVSYSSMAPCGLVARAPAAAASVSRYASQLCRLRPHIVARRSACPWLRCAVLARARTRARQRSATAHAAACPHGRWGPTWALAGASDSRRRDCAAARSGALRDGRGRSGKVGLVGPGREKGAAVKLIRGAAGVGETRARRRNGSPHRAAPAC